MLGLTPNVVQKVEPGHMISSKSGARKIRISVRASL